MRVNVIGPNLPDQSKGSFHVHKDTCRDGIRLDRMTGMGDIVEVETKADAVLFVYDNGILEEGADWLSCFEDLYFCPCCSDLPDGEAPIEYRRVEVTLELRAADLERILASDEVFDNLDYGAQSELRRAVNELTGGDA